MAGLAKIILYIIGFVVLLPIAFCVITALILAVAIVIKIVREL